MASPAVALAFFPMTSFPPSSVAPTHAGCEQGVPRLLSLLTISPEALQSVGGFPELFCRCDWLPLMCHSQSLPDGVSNSATAFDEAAPSCCALAEKDSRPSPPLPSLPGGVCDLSPDEGLESVLLICAQQRTAHSFDRSACMWSRLLRVASRWWCR